MSALSEIGELFLNEELKLYENLAAVTYGHKVKFVLRPIEYAMDVHLDFLRKYCRSAKKVLFLGMNPGPWGMMQNAVPFGESSSVRDFLGLAGSVKQPPAFHPSRPVQGLDCRRSEVSGRRFWSFAAHLGADDPLRFFQNAFVHNYFPHCLLDDNGKNVTPPELKGLQPDAKKYIDQCCDRSLINVLSILQVEVVLAIGRYVQTKIDALVKTYKIPTKVVYLPHPSPRNPASNKNWLETAKLTILENNLAQYFHMTDSQNGLQ
ncbi:single-strand selective monofunctional uracil DNA [Nesidiocoris tenuis]|uniref:Single-strand selective monofunctional uracil DNA n=1 Tax=Nesidiocoris tenuis TaxID=355587 RepID=A0ABN7B644_9HEMI|nr:single-strand selective monofunctional uracil DNA [Nesidiocoris tenuis]